MSKGKKSFKDNPAMAYISTQDTQDTPDALEVQEQQATPKGRKPHPTQGKKGKKLPRINMAFSQDNIDYLTLISRVEGCSKTEYVNRLIAKDQKKRKDVIEQAKALFGDK